MYNYYINKFADSKDEMFKDDDESKFQCEDVPVHGRQVPLLVPKTFVVTVRLEWNYFQIGEKSDP